MLTTDRLLVSNEIVHTERIRYATKRVTSTARQSKTPAITQIASKMQNELHVSILTLQTIAITIQVDATGK